VPMPILRSRGRRAYYRLRAVTAADISRTSWRKSSFSAMNGNCVEVGRLKSDRIGVRDTKDHGRGPVLIFTDADWGLFIAEVRSGQLDDS
jgi:uncharacterized protein YcsI (UPF0317 family)